MNEEAQQNYKKSLLRKIEIEKKIMNHKADVILLKQ